MARLFWLTVMAAFAAALLAGASWAGALLAVGTLLGSPPPAMRHALLRRHRRLGERHPEITRKEERIVSEAAAAAGLGEDPAVARCFDQLRLGERRVEICHHTTVARGALVVGNAREPLEQQRVVRRVSHPRPVHLRPTRREHTRRPLERVHLEPRVLRERWNGATLREVARLRHRVFGEARAPLEIGLIG